MKTPPKMMITHTDNDPRKLSREALDEIFRDIGVSVSSSTVTRLCLADLLMSLATSKLGPKLGLVKYRQYNADVATMRLLNTCIEDGVVNKKKLNDMILEQIRVDFNKPFTVRLY
jgi:hypothetical protein